MRCIIFLLRKVHCWSGGKDSTANIILQHLYEGGEADSVIIMSEVMFNEEISGELPEHMEWVKNIAIPLFESWGFTVKILHSPYTFMDCFNRVNQGKRTPARKGKRYGFPMSGKCLINSLCKMLPIKDFLKSIDEPYIQYVGIAIDEPDRIKTMHKNSTKQSLLEKYNYTEKDAYILCEKYRLLSPIYEKTKRGGCWFCPNQKDCQLRNTRDNHNDLWQILLSLEMQEDTIGNIWDTRGNRSLHQKEEQFKWEDAQLSIFDFLG